MNQKRKGLYQLLACLMVLVMLISLSPVNVQAASKVKINKTKTTMYVGTPKTLKITGTTKKVTWKSSNKKIATVSAKGKVTPKKAGTVVITAKVSGKNYKCKVTVKKPYLSATKKTVKAGSTYKLVLHGTNVKKCSSTNKSIATVKKNGKNAVTVKAVKTGNVKIRVRGTNGKLYICNVKVKPVTEKPTTEEPVTTEHQHNWVEVKHEAEVKPAWREEVHTTETHVVCKGCGEDFYLTGHAGDYDYYNYHVDSVCHSSYGSKTVDVVSYVDHPEETIKAAYTSYKCSTCGATK